jgi:uncharacterized protein (TIGR03437 family)
MKLTQIHSSATLVLAVLFPMAAFADINSTATVNAGGNFNFDTGTNVSSGGDISFTGTNITFVGSAKGGNLGALGASTYTTELTQAALQALAAAATTAPIPLSSLGVGDIFALQTNGGNGAKAMVTASTAASITFQFTTYESGTGGGATTPTITAVVSGSDLIPAGFANSGVAPSSLIAIQGTGLTGPNITPVLQDSSKGLPSTLNNTSVTVTVAGKTVTPALYYTCSVNCGGPATQLAAVLPASTPVGTGTITVTYNGATSAPAPITVVSSAYGIDNYDGNTAVAQYSTSSTGALVTYTNSAKPGDYVTIWGTGLGADPADSDTTETSSPHNYAINTPPQVYIGGIPSTNVTYAGASPYPGVDILVFQLPSGIPNGCFVPVAVVTGTSPSVVSNTPTLPIMNSGGVCTDSVFGISGTQISTLLGQGTVNSGSVIVGQVTQPSNSGTGTQTEAIALANFQQNTGGSFASGGVTSLGGCIISETVSSGSPSTSTGLNAGTVTVTGPSGGPVTLTAIPQIVGEYEAQLTAAIPSTGGAFIFNGTGGSGANSIGSFTATVTFPNPLLNWTNQSAAATVTRNVGLQVTWTGGTAGSFVIITGSSSGTGSSGSYTCFAPQSALQFTVPPYILSALPAGTGNTTVENGTNYSSFTATGLNYGTGFGFSGFMVSSTYQ